LLSKDEIFDISNHRIGFVISGLFLSYLYLLVSLKTKEHKGILVKTFSVLVFLLTLIFSNSSQNPLYVSGRSFLENKILLKIFLAKAENFNPSSDLVLGMNRSSKVPKNDDKCLNEIVTIINNINPTIYTGPDYLGAHASNREVNALFPARFWDADLVIADIFETKTINPLGSTGWTFNKEGLRRLVDSKNYSHFYSCGRISAFQPGNTEDSSQSVSDIDNTLKWYELKTDRITLELAIKEISTDSIKILVKRKEGNFLDKTTFWTYENVSDESIKFSFINYLSIGFRESLDQAKLGDTVLEIYHPKVKSRLPMGEYNVFYGVGDLLNAREIYIGTITIQ